MESQSLSSASFVSRSARARPVFGRFFFLSRRRPPGSPLFPYTTLFRSSGRGTRCSGRDQGGDQGRDDGAGDRKSTRLNSSHVASSYAVFCLKKKQSVTKSSSKTRNCTFRTKFYSSPRS